ncbi:CLUMA_CG013308, isoform A [Clunio marinus]|uniref:CLUMA_CG013308, isoform A n=1 Tax=Clunio marinus TaxID=568069 RepID=A0A1J1IKF6_9DIPT|nr:CLUMA_CG013308, isoform A [Clunio marinus]
MKMRIAILIFLTYFIGNILCVELDSIKDEAVFQGKCSSNLCTQLCYEVKKSFSHLCQCTVMTFQLQLHDGMFECDCTQGYELNLDGYSCKQKNISYNLSYNESKFNDDFSSSDVFYQKGVSFSAKLGEAEDITSESGNEKESFKDYDNQNYKNSGINDIQDAINVFNIEGSFNNKSNDEHLYPKLPDVTVNIPRFYQSSWLAFRPLKGANLVTEINIEFRPEMSNGILLISGEKEDLNGDFMVLTLSNGFIEFLFDCGSGRSSIIRSSEKVMLHQWNTLIIYRYRWDAWLELNEKRRIRGRSVGIFSRITFRSLVFLGGKGNFTTEALLKKKIHSTKGFSGCIRKFIINGHQYELSTTSSSDVIASSNLNECTIDQCSFIKCLHGGKCQSNSASCLCPLGFGGEFCEKKLDLKYPMFNGTSNLRYASLGDSAIIWLEVKVVLKPHIEDGLILFSGKSDFGDFIALYLNFGFVEFMYDLGSGLTSVKSKFPITINEWHTIKISRTARLAVMKVDTQPEVMTISPNGFWHLSLATSIFLGGISKPNLLPTNLRDKGSFVGCIKEFELNDRKIGLIEDALGGYNVGSCPFNDLSVINRPQSINVNQTNLSDQIKKQNDFEGTNSHIKQEKKKYSFDVIEDMSVNTNLNVKSFDSNNSLEMDENDNEIKDDAIHNRIVRVSLQKPSANDNELCFKGNASIVFYDIHKLLKSPEKHETRINIRFKTFSANGLLLLVYQKQSIKFRSFLSLSIENGYMHLRFGHTTTSVVIKSDETKVDDGLWHRVRAKNLKGTLRIDGGRSFTSRKRDKNKFASLTPGLYLGGTSAFSSSLPAFKGCISDVILKTDNHEHHLDLKQMQNVNSDEKL